MGRLVFVWDNFGPLHADRCDAVASRLAGKHEVIGLELAEQSSFYSWVSEHGTGFRKITLVKGRGIDQIPFAERVTKTLRVCLSFGRQTQFFLCNYQDPAILTIASVLRLFGCRVYATSCSKFDDYERTLRKEVLKSLFFLPYHGGIASGTRSRDYLRFLGVPKARIEGPYNAVSLDRIRKLSGLPPAPQGVPHRERHFTIVSRLVWYKNLAMALRAMAYYAARVADPRPLHIFGNGPLEGELREQAHRDGIEHLVFFHGFLQTAEVSRAYGHSLALLLPSLEEQFGNVVPEALAMGLPVILSERCGARDQLVRSGVNGFVIEPDNPEGMAYFMQLLSEDESLWQRMCHSSQQFAEQGDSARFAEAVDALVSTKR